MRYNLDTSTQAAFTFVQVIGAVKSFIHVSPFNHPPRLKEGRPRGRFLSKKKRHFLLQRK